MFWILINYIKQNFYNINSGNKLLVKTNLDFQLSYNDMGLYKLPSVLQKMGTGIFQEVLTHDGIVDLANAIHDNKLREVNLFCEKPVTKKFIY